MTRAELFNRLEKLGVTQDRAERLGTAWTYLAAAVVGYKNFQSLTNQNRVSAMIAGNVKGIENMFAMPQWRDAAESDKDEFFKHYLPAAQKHADKARKNARRQWKKRRK